MHFHATLITRSAQTADINIGSEWQNVIPYSPVVRIPGFHPGGPGSIPGVGNSFFLLESSNLFILDRRFRLSERDRIYLLGMRPTANGKFYSAVNLNSAYLSCDDRSWWRRFEWPTCGAWTWVSVSTFKIRKRLLYPNSLTLTLSLEPILIISKIRWSMWDNWSDIELENSWSHDLILLSVWLWWVLGKDVYQLSVHAKCVYLLILLSCRYSPFIDGRFSDIMKVAKMHQGSFGCSRTERCWTILVRFCSGFGGAWAAAKLVKGMAAVGFEPTPFRTGALNQRLRPLGHATYEDTCARNTVIWAVWIHVWISNVTGLAVYAEPVTIVSTYVLTGNFR